jgi:hypothetical protein
MVQCGSRTSTISLVTGRRVDAVRHVSDPKLSLNADQREQGAWDFTDEHYENKMFQVQMERRVKALEKQIAALITKQPQAKGRKNAKGASRDNPAAREALAKYHALKKEAQELGIDVSGMKTAQLQEAVNDAKKLAENQLN